MFVVARELRHPLGTRFELIGFVDAGQVFSEPGDIDPFDLRLSFGPGVRVRTPVGPTRLFHAWVLHPEPGESGSQWHFTFGTQS